jgi:hypothetical protein
LATVFLAVDFCAVLLFAAGVDLALLARGPLARVLAALLRPEVLLLAFCSVLAARDFVAALGCSDAGFFAGDFFAAVLLEVEEREVPLARVFAARLRACALLPLLARVFAALDLLDALGFDAVDLFVIMQFTPMRLVSIISAFWKHS